MELAKLLSVVALAAIELWAAIPAGLALQLDPVTVGIASATGAILGAVAVVLLGSPVRAWLLKRFGRRKADRKSGWVQRVWRRYGLMGLGLLAPLITGVPLGVAVGLGLAAPAGRLILWSSLGAVVWTVILTFAATVGLAGIRALFG